MKEKRLQGKRRLTGSTLAKIVAYFILTISLLTGGGAAVMTAYMASMDVYTYGDSSIGAEKWAKNNMYSLAWEDLTNFYFKKWPEGQTELEKLLDNYCKDKNIRIEVFKTYMDRTGEQEKVVSNYENFSTPYTYSRSFTEYEQVEQEEADIEEPETSAEQEKSKQSEETEKLPGTDSNEGNTTIIPENGAMLLEGAVATETQNSEQEAVTDAEKKPVMEEVRYEVLGYVDPEFPIYDGYKVMYLQAVEAWNYRYVLPVVALSGLLLCIICFLFLMCGAGHKNGKEGITPGVLASIHVDVLTIGFCFVAFMVLLFGVEVSRNWDTIWCLLGMVVTFTVDAVWGTIYCAELAARMKQGLWWKHSVIYGVLRVIGRGVASLLHMIVSVVKGLPLIVNTALIFFAVCLAEFIGLAVFDAHDELIIAWFFEKLIIAPIVLYIALICKKMQEGSKALAEGNLTYQIDTSKMLLDFKEHGENLNQIGQGIAKAVEERMKSEHLKTELITNVSHDIKTPLTSIINYADLLGNAANAEAPLEQEKVAEYSEVLLRQSKRLKKLLEDLVEASKATTGNLDVKMERCEVGVLLSQAVGEYEPRFWEKQLELIVKQPENPVWIMADGRRLWRVFDNLLNNVCKYAQENTRVYLTVEPKENQVQIIFRNMSKYALELSGEELEERFVRGDKSRHMEGNGLGLSIAKSLVELQNGSMEIVTDGDLFKVILRFPML